MIINDLNYLESTNEEIFGGGSSRGGKNIKFDKDIKIDIDVDSKIDSKADVKGNVAQGYADASAYGKDTFSDAEAVTYAIENKYSGSTATSTSAVR
ncbi:MAG: hypothetical protein RMX68_008935 [Aulosira sp. ZfuVER01]|nr:hypothetical protein [Aulosira sp. ZfuVER01]MDZ7998679.1 hypothetical protein [Aulosira sp. DedVER01a]MDZ8054851.1 hypothetical protein [Aulosira sp. ZfuCHP01]